MITHSEMVTLLAKDGDTIASELTGNDAHVLHMSVGIAGEAGELLEAVLNAHLSGDPVDRENVVEEFGDLEFYLEGLRQGLDITRESTLQPPSKFAYNGTSVEAVVIAASISIKAGDILDCIKRKTIYRTKDEAKAQKIADKTVSTLGDLETLMDVLRSIYAITREETLEANMNKLLTGENARYKEGYSDQAAQDRADKLQDGAAIAGGAQRTREGAPTTGKTLGGAPVDKVEA